MAVFGMSPDTTYYFALRTLDDRPNTSGVSTLMLRESQPAERLDNSSSQLFRESFLRFNVLGLDCSRGQVRLQLSDG